MSDDELSTTRQWSDDSPPDSGAEEGITCRFTNALTGNAYFTSQLQVDSQMSVGFIFNLVFQQLGERDFRIAVGRQIWTIDNVYDKFWLCSYVMDALGAARDGVLDLQVTMLATAKDKE